MKKHCFTRRHLFSSSGALVLGLASFGLPAFAQEVNFPTGPVRIVMPFPPGTGNETFLRIVSDRLSQRWKQPVVIDNRPGASSMIATAHVAEAKPDGHTLLANITLIIQNPVLRSKLPYSPQALVPVTQLHQQQLPIFVRTNSGIKNMDELIARAKADPGKINFATWGEGSTAHIILSKIEQDKQVRFTHIPYKGGADIIKAVLSDESDVAVADFSAPQPHIKSGKFRMIAVTGPKRLESLPEVPTLAESGIKGFEGYNWFGLFAPKETPAGVMRKIATDIANIVADPQLQTRFRTELLVEPKATTPDEFAKIYANDEATWTSVIKATKIRMD